MFYNYFRDYDQTTGRYIESDPIGLEGGINTFAYVGGNPLLRVDEFGLLGRAPGRGANAGGTWSFGIGGCIGACVNYNSKPGQGTQLSFPVIPELGGGISICFGPSPKQQNQCSATPSETCHDGVCYPNYSGGDVSYGLGRHFGVSVDNEGMMCINIGPSLGAPIAPHANTPLPWKK